MFYWAGDGSWGVPLGWLEDSWPWKGCSDGWVAAILVGCRLDEGER